MYKNLLGWLTAVLILPSCSNNVPTITVVAEENSVGNSVIVWETTPDIEGKVKIYASTNPENIPEKNPVATANISDQYLTIVTTDPTQRYYYKMVYNNRYRVTTATRNVNIPGVQNFRDMGGYMTPKNKTIKWGMIYRSGQMDNLPYSSHTKLKNMGIKTIIDLRLDSEVQDTSLEENGFKVVRIPIGVTNMNDVVQDLVDRRIGNDSIYRLMLRVNRELVTYYREEYRKIFDVLLEEDNYPLVINSTTGKGKTAIASALIMASLGMDDTMILYDYRNSNNYFNIPQATNYGYSLPVSTQEALTTLFTARESFLNAAKGQIEKNYGDMSTYLERGIGLTNDEIKHLRSILLE